MKRRALRLHSETVVPYAVVDLFVENASPPKGLFRAVENTVQVGGFPQVAEFKVDDFYNFHFKH